MHALAIDGAARKWYHVVLRTYRRRPLFKIPAAQRFCERELARTLARGGWVVEAIHWGSASVHVLVQPPPGLGRARIVRELRRQAARVVRRGGVPVPRREPVFAPDVWSAAISHAAGAAAVRRHINGRAGAHAAVPVNTPGANGRL